VKPEVSKSNSGGLMGAKQMSKLQKAASAKMASKMGTANAVKPAKPPKQKLTSSKGPSWKPVKPGGSGKTFDYPAGNYGKLVSAAARARVNRGDVNRGDRLKLTQGQLKKGFMKATQGKKVKGTIRRPPPGLKPPIVSRGVKWTDPS